MTTAKIKTFVSACLFMAGFATMAPTAHAQDRIQQPAYDAFRSRLVAESCGTAQLAPVAYGQVERRFGEQETQNLHSRGVTIVTSAGAAVSAPAGGFVEFVGPVDNLGQVVILNIGREYRVVMTGLGRVSVHTGQTLAAYDAVGLMPAQTGRDAKLYMELRCGEEPVNPEQTMVIALR